MAIFALDYDGTYTVDPQLWRQFVSSARNNGHTVYIVTMRTAEEAYSGTVNFPVMDPLLLQLMGAKGEKDMGVILCTNRRAKKPYVEGVLGIPVDVWIDDAPHFILTNAN